MNSTDYILINEKLLYRNYWLDSTSEDISILMTIVFMAESVPIRFGCKEENPEGKIQVKTSYLSIADSAGNGTTPNMVKKAMKNFENYGLLTRVECGVDLFITIEDIEVFKVEYQVTRKEDI